MNATGRTLMRYYRAMRDRFGHRGWWPGEGRLEICVGAILTQNTNWKNVEKAIISLRDSGNLSIDRLVALRESKLARLIRPAGYYNVKAKRLKNFIKHVRSAWGADLDAMLDRPVSVLRRELLSINGIGPETADSIILYAAERASFVVDAYTVRIFLRHGLIGPDDNYSSIKELCEKSLPGDVDLWNDFHAQIVETGKNFCRPRARCEGCPLEAFRPRREVSSLA